MALLAIDLGGTKLAFAIFDDKGNLLNTEVMALNSRSGSEVGEMITSQISKFINAEKLSIHSIGISVPGIYRMKTGTVWAPNIPGWDNYPLLEEVKEVSNEIPVTIDSDRACYILGEAWQGNARECSDAIFLAVGTGIGAGILTDGNILRGSHDIAGAIGWMALSQPFKDEYFQCGCFEHYASGEGITKVARKILKETKNYSGELNEKAMSQITCQDVFAAYENNDPVAMRVIQIGIEFWGMAVANLVSLFNPEKIILGGGVFGPATKLIPAIKTEAAKWAQPISIRQVSIEASALGSDAGVYGAGFLALKNNSQ
jgi:glucokinase